MTGEPFGEGRGLDGAGSAVENVGRPPAGRITQTRAGGVGLTENQARTAAVRSIRPGRVVIVSECKDGLSVGISEGQNFAAVGEAGVVGKFAEHQSGAGRTVTGQEGRAVADDHAAGSGRDRAPFRKDKSEASVEEAAAEVEGLGGAVEEFEEFIVVLVGGGVDLGRGDGFGGVVMNFADHEVSGGSGSGHRVGFLEQG